MLGNTRTGRREAIVQKLIASLNDIESAYSKEWLSAFLEVYYGAASLDELREHNPRHLIGAALSHLQLSQTRADKHHVVRVYNPTEENDGWHSPHTIIQTVAMDSPFIVDSISLCAQSHQLRVYSTLHPVLAVSRSKGGKVQSIDPQDLSDTSRNESFVYMEVTKVTEQNKLGALADALNGTLDDVGAAVADWTAMRDMAAKIAYDLDPESLPLDPDEVEEGRNFLHWLADNYFTFLGYRRYELEFAGKRAQLKQVAGSGLGILRASNSDDKPLTLPSELKRRALAPEFAIITKANSRSTVHRSAYLDYIGIKRYDASGNVCGEHRFLGLFTSPVYSLNPLEIPIVRRKISSILETSGFAPGSHSGKALLQSLQTLPRDELFQANEQELSEIANGILLMQERPQVRLFVRRDAFGRFYSCLIYAPRERYNSTVRERMQEILGHELKGQEIETFVHMGESILARVHMIVHTRPWQRARIGHKRLEHALELATETWEDRLRVSLIRRHGERRGLFLFNTWGLHFPAAYQEDTAADKAPHDIRYLTRLSQKNPVDLSLYRSSTSPEGVMRVKLFSREQPIVVSDALPLLENMGLKVLAERPYEIQLADDSVFWIHDLEVLGTHGNNADIAQTQERFRAMFLSTWTQQSENDALNALVLKADLDWLQVRIIRAYAKYLLQTGMPFGERYVEEILCSNPRLCSLAVQLFETQFDPSIDQPTRNSSLREINASLDTCLNDLTGQDDDRIWRAMVGFIRSSLRTNHYIRGRGGKAKPYLSFKLNSKQITELPLPRPAVEIFVYAPYMEGIHLRGGLIARGGLRWSDRKADFRTEVLGLMKAQMVKNTVIVPVGSKGGFIAKKLSAAWNKDETLTEVKRCYRDFIRGLLDITDNIVHDQVVPPSHVVRHDQDDPYLVVAADKGTATFSDLANEIAADYGFWLGDAFASGGSVGYDHKELAITARGAWESAKRLFGEMGIDPERDAVTAFGIGDMSGDVFGNGMLMSKSIRLLAAFDHRHIFIDPNPDPVKSYEERKRLYELDRSSWEDYDRGALSGGGAVYPRAAKSIQVSTEAQAALGLTKGSYRPQELIKEILKAPVDLFWNGGIGTYVKAASESHLDVGDRANDSVRINGKDLRCKVVVEGGNLGVTQLGRVEYSRHGGHITTDFIDNSAGVDCSDHEVNIKIFLNLFIQKKQLSEAERRRKLTAMTQEVSGLVLRDNYLQALALSVAESQSQTHIDEHAHLLRTLERMGSLDRKLEYLPSEDDLVERRAAKQGFTRPELAVLLAYAKITLKNSMDMKALAEDEYLSRELSDYFPDLIRRQFSGRIEHPLRNAIIGTAITNSMINRMGPNFPFRVQEATGASLNDVARAYTIARESLNMLPLWRSLERLSLPTHAKLQTHVISLSSHLVHHATRWLLEHEYGNAGIMESVKQLKPCTEQLLNMLPGVLSPSLRKHYEDSLEQHSDPEIQDDTRKLIAAIPALYCAFDVHLVSTELNMSVEEAAKVYFELGSVLELDWLRDQIESLPVDDHWKAMSRASLRERLYAQQRRLAIEVLGNGGKPNAAECVNKWLCEKKPVTKHFLDTLSEIKTTGQVEYASMSVAVEETYSLRSRPGNR